MKKKEVNRKGVEELPDFDKITFEKVKARDIGEVLPIVSNFGISLLQKFIELNPLNRIHAGEALLDNYFFSEPLPTPSYILVKEIPFLVSEKVAKSGD